MRSTCLGLGKFGGNRQRRQILPIGDVQLGAHLIRQIEHTLRIVARVAHTTASSATCSRRRYRQLANDSEMEDGVAIRVLHVRVGLVGAQQAEAVLLLRARGERQRVLAPVGASACCQRTALLCGVPMRSPGVVGLHRQVDPFVLHRVCTPNDMTRVCLTAMSRSLARAAGLLIVGTEEGAVAALVHVGADRQQVAH